MKRVPESASERQIVHVTTGTGDLQRFVLSAGNFDPDVIVAMARLETEPIQGYRLADVRTGESRLEFAVVRDADGVWLSHNVVYLHHWPPSLELETTILRPLPRAEAAILAGLERCAAIALAGIDTRNWYSQSQRRGRAMRVIYLALITALALLALLLAAVAALHAQGHGTALAVYSLCGTLEHMHTAVGCYASRFDGFVGQVLHHQFRVTTDFIGQVANDIFVCAVDDGSAAQGFQRGPPSGPTARLV